MPVVTNPVMKLWLKETDRWYVRVAVLDLEKTTYTQYVAYCQTTECCFLQLNLAVS